MSYLNQPPGGMVMMHCIIFLTGTGLQSLHPCVWTVPLPPQEGTRCCAGPSGSYDWVTTTTTQQFQCEWLRVLFYTTMKRICSPTSNGGLTVNQWSITWWSLLKPILLSILWELQYFIPPPGQFFLLNWTVLTVLLIKTSRSLLPVGIRAHSLQ